MRDPVEGAGATSRRAPPTAPRRTRGSWTSPAHTGLILVGLAGALALVVADFCTLYQVKVGATTVSSVSGHRQHDYALLLLGLAALAMLWGALRAATPAMFALAAIGVAAVLAGPVADHHDVNSAGLISDAFAGAAAHPAVGYRLETIGSVLLLVCGGGLALVHAGTRGPRPRRRRRRAGSGGPAEPPETERRLAVNPFVEEDSG